MVQSSSTAIAAEGPPMPLEVVETAAPPTVPVKVRYSRENAFSVAPSRYCAISAVRNGSPGMRT